MFKKILPILFVWRVFVLLSALPAIFIIPLRTGFTHATEILSAKGLIEMWSNFDGLHYLLIAKYGYLSKMAGYKQAFFPVFPTLINLGQKLIGDYLAAGLLISHLSFVAAIFVLYKLIRLDYSVKVANQTLYLLLVFPAAFFFGSVYSESLFLLLTVSAVFAARKSNWFLACLLAGIASGTRITGIFIIPLLLIEFWLAHQKSIRQSISDPRLVFFLLSPIGLLLYMFYLNNTVHDPFFFAHLQPLFGAGRQVSHLTLLYQVFYRYGRMLIYVNHFDPLFFTVLLEFLTGGLFLVLCLLAFKYSRLSYAIYAMLSYLLPTFTGTFSSMPRYVLVLFPCFIILSTWMVKQKTWVQVIYYSLSVIFSIISISLFTRGYFVG